MQIRVKTWEHTNFVGISEGLEKWKSIFSCWQWFAGNDFWAFLAGKQRIKFSLKGIIFHHFKVQMSSFHNQISHIRHTYEKLSLGTPDKSYLICTSNFK